MLEEDPSRATEQKELMCYEICKHKPVHKHFGRGINFSVLYMTNPRSTGRSKEARVITEGKIVKWREKCHVFVYTMRCPDSGFYFLFL